MDGSLRFEEKSSWLRRIFEEYFIFARVVFFGIFGLILFPVLFDSTEDKVPGALKIFWFIGASIWFIYSLLYFTVNKFCYTKLADEKSGFVLMKVINGKLVEVGKKVWGTKNVFVVHDLFEYIKNGVCTFQVLFVVDNIYYKSIFKVRFSKEFGWPLVYEEVLKKDQTIDIFGVLDQWGQKAIIDREKDIASKIQKHQKGWMTEKVLEGYLKGLAFQMMKTKPFNFVQDVTISINKYNM